MFIAFRRHLYTFNIFPLKNGASILLAMVYAHANIYLHVLILGTASTSPTCGWVHQGTILGAMLIYPGGHPLTVTVITF